MLKKIYKAFIYPTQLTNIRKHSKVNKIRLLVIPKGSGTSVNDSMKFTLMQIPFLIKRLLLFTLHFGYFSRNLNFFCSHSKYFFQSSHKHLYNKHDAFQLFASLDQLHYTKTVLIWTKKEVSKNGKSLKADKLLKINDQQ